MAPFQMAPWTAQKPPTSRLTSLSRLPAAATTICRITHTDCSTESRDVSQHGGWRHQRADRVLLTNSAGTAITLGNPAVNPSTGQVADFRSAAVAAGQTACVNGGVIQPGASCSIGFQFVPTTAGARTATFSVTFVGNAGTRHDTARHCHRGRNFVCTDLVGQRAIERRRRGAGLDELARIARAARR